jgi:hypothetical protein
MWVHNSMQYKVKWLWHLYRTFWNRVEHQCRGMKVRCLSLDSYISEDTLNTLYCNWSLTLLYFHMCVYVFGSLLYIQFLLSLLGKVLWYPKTSLYSSRPPKCPKTNNKRQHPESYMSPKPIDFREENKVKSQALHARGEHLKIFHFHRNVLTLKWTFRSQI